MDELRVVEIFASEPSVGSSFGTGYLVAPGLVLTARHVVEPALLSSGSCEVRLLGDFLEGRTEWHRFAVCWNDADRDLALLSESAVPVAGRFVPRQHTAFGTLIRDHHLMNCGGLGFPKVLRHEGRNETQQVVGSIHKLSMLKDGRWQVQVTSPRPRDPLDWKGVSGAALFAGDRLIGVVVETETRYAEGVLIAQPLKDVLSLPEWTAQWPAGHRMVIEPVSAPNLSNHWDDLYKLIFLVDRQAQSTALNAALEITVDAPAAPRALFCAILGRPEDEHGDLIALFRNETMPRMFAQQIEHSIEYLEWPERAESVPEGLANLRRQLHGLLLIRDGDPARSARNIADALKAATKSRSFYCDIRATEFTPLQEALARAWLAEWSKIAAEGLNDLVTVFFCLVLNATAQTNSQTFWKSLFRPSRTLSSLPDFARTEFGTLDGTQLVQDRASRRMLLLAPLGDCQRKPHIPDWRRKLEANSAYTGLAQHVTQIELTLLDERFPLRTLVKTIASMRQT